MPNLVNLNGTAWTFFKDRQRHKNTHKLTELQIYIKDIKPVNESEQMS